MTNTQDDCRRAFERWYNDFPVGGRAAKEGLAWTVWQAAWSTRPSAMRDVVKFLEEIGDISGKYPYVNRTEIVSDSRKLLAKLQDNASATQPAPLNVDELVRDIEARICGQYRENEAYGRGLDQAFTVSIALIRKWAEGKL